MSKILLVNPPFYRFMGLEQDYVPLSLLAVGSQMEKNGDEVFLKNMEVGEDLCYKGYTDRGRKYHEYIEALSDSSNPVWHELDEIINNVNPDIVGVNILNVKHRSALKVLEIARFHEKKLLVGGNYPTMKPEAYDDDVEVFRGEYESHGKRTESLDNTPFPNYDILMDKYSPNGYAHILSSRGCPFNCRFCASKLMWDRKVTYKSVDRILDEMHYIYHRFNPSYFTFWDEVFTLDKKRLKEFCYRYDLPVRWRCDTRADSITEESVTMMKYAGCHQMSIGVECADDNILRYIGKNENRDDFQRAAEILNKHGIQWKAYMIIGFPKDTEKIIRRSLDFVKSLKPFRITLSFVTPYEGTSLYDECKQLGLINKYYDIASYSHQSPHNYFCPRIKRKRYKILKAEITNEIDDYNIQALKTWK
jgi:radical SAM superfamily enzyme YgiQ (UPF0313 family)